ncbi:MAG: hydantoinase/oxoprolinase family protein [Firmicutes bacterium]|nr:hydantoinase/oxoprolinase family protein [Bacillota bacterium]
MRIAIDTGGTFTDCVFVRDGRLEILKVPSTPRQPAQAIAEVLRRLVAKLGGESCALTLGTTVGTNALLERRGGRIALVTTAGLEDVLEIGRQARPRLYDFFVERPAPLVPASRRFGLAERVGWDGRVLQRPTAAAIARVVGAVRHARAEAVAVCFLFSFAHPAHEAAMTRALRAAGFAVSASHEILPEFREYERTATTVVNAYLLPVMGRYLAEVERVAGGAVRVMQSSGGILSARRAAREPVRTILSGPAGGVLGAQYVAERAGFDDVISLDMGGTSTDVALVSRTLRTTNEATVAGLPVAVPMLDIHTVGAGGGSIARFDRGGALRVGPESAGADPGPICYGRGEQPTVTDAHLVLGRLAPQGFLGGEFRLDERRTRDYLERFLRRAPGALRSLEEFAQGVLDVANATMEKAIRVISLERGYDPRDYTLVAFGGAGGLHACELAAALAIPRILIPKFPGVLSALGILRADVVRDFSRTIRLPVASLAAAREALRRIFAVLERRGQADLAHEGFSAAELRFERLLEMRYIGQAYELAVPAGGDFVTAFHRAHQQRYGYAEPGRPVEIVTVRLRVAGRTAKPELPRSRPVGHSPKAALTGEQRIYHRGRMLSAAIYDRARLRAGHRFAGPALVTEYSATTFVPPGWQARVDGWENLRLTRR